MSASTSSSARAVTSDSVRIFFAVGGVDPVTVSSNTITISRSATEFTGPVTFGSLRLQLGSTYNLTQGVKVQFRCQLIAAANGKQYWSALSAVTLRSVTPAGIISFEFHHQSCIMTDVILLLIA